MMPMTTKNNVIVLCLSLALLSACGTTGTQAPVVERTATASSGRPAAEPARPLDPAMYTVKRGDTLIRIALEYGQNYRDLVTWNNLSNANDIKVDQVLRVVPPDAGNGSWSKPCSCRRRSCSAGSIIGRSARKAANGESGAGIWT